MIVFRVIQAIAGSADYPTAMAIIAVTFSEGRERAQALGIWSASFAAAAVFGPLLGGPLIDIFGWRSVFLINLPVGIVGLFMAMRYINESTSEVKSKHFDWWGAVTLGISLSTLVLVLEKGFTWGWFSIESLLCYFVTFVSLGLFIRIEQKTEEPIVDLKFFKIPAFVNTLLNNFIVFMGMMGSMFLVPVFAQIFLGYSATETGLLFIPMVACMMISSTIGGRLAGRVESRYVIFISTVVAAIGTFLFVGIDAKSGAMSLILPLMVMALGMGLGMAQRTNIVASVVDQHEIGIASSVLALVRNIAGAFGIAVFTTMLNNRIEHNVLQINKYSHLFSTNPYDAEKYIGLITLKAQVNAYSYVFMISAIIILLGSFTILSLKVKEKIGVKVHVE
jgi:DHA2 family multidrug resistance protein